MECVLVGSTSPRLARARACCVEAHSARDGRECTCHVILRLFWRSKMTILIFENDSRVLTQRITRCAASCLCILSLTNYYKHLLHNMVTMSSSTTLKGGDSACRLRRRRVKPSVDDGAANIKKKRCLLLMSIMGVIVVFLWTVTLASYMLDQVILPR